MNTFEKLSQSTEHAGAALQNVEFVFQAIESRRFSLKRKKEIDKKSLMSALRQAIGQPVNSVRVLTPSEIGIRPEWQSVEEFWASHNVSAGNSLQKYIAHPSGHDDILSGIILCDSMLAMGNILSRQYPCLAEDCQVERAMTDPSLDMIADANLLQLVIEYVAAVEYQDAARAATLLPLLQLSQHCLVLFDSAAKEGHWYVFADD